MNNKEEVFLSNRFIFNITGVDGFDFLQSIVTAEIKPLYEKKAVACCLLTPQGRILFDFIIYPSENISSIFSVFIDCEAIEKDELIKRMSMYKLRSDVDIIERPEKGISVSFSAGNETFFDPRHKKMPYRKIVNRKNLIFNENELNNFNNFRQSLCIAEGKNEIPRGKALPLDYWMDKTGQISFEKGCFIGQEVTARVFHRNKIRRRLIVVDLENKKPELDSIPSKDFKVIYISKNKAFLLAPIDFIGREITNKIIKKIKWSNYNFTFFSYH